MLTIDSIGRITLDGADTGLHVRQAAKTIVYRPEITALQARSLGREPQRYAEITLPEDRYSLAHDQPASGNPGRARFEADLRAALGALS